MKAFKIIIAFVIAVPVLFFALGTLLPKQTQLQRSIDINAPIGTVFHLVSDLREFSRWDPWSKKDPNIRVRFSGPDLGVGSVRSWSGNSQVGSGSMTMTGYNPNASAAMSILFGQAGAGDARYDLVEKGSTTTITWSFYTVHQNIIARYFGLAVEDMLGKDYEKGLASLKAIAESEPLDLIKTQDVSYKVDGTELNGFLAYPVGLLDPVPGVLVVHEWWGHNDYARERAKMLAKEGYVAFALDMYGDGKLAEHPQDAGKFMEQVGTKTALAEARFDAAVEILQKNYFSDPNNIAAIGYCFGGAVVMNMARMGKPLKGVASFHGGLGGLVPIDSSRQSSIAPMLVLNGAEDPFVTAEQKQQFQQEMNAAGVTYEFVDYPGALHSFTNPGADALGEKFELPLKYDQQADDDSWQKLKEFLPGVFF